jgi:hypothetical protein
MARQPVLYVRSPKQWETILAPIRTEILQGLRCLGPCSAGELAEMLDRPDREHGAAFGMREIEPSLTSHQRGFALFTDGESERAGIAPETPGEERPHHATAANVAVAMHFETEGRGPFELLSAQPRARQRERQDRLLVEGEGRHLDRDRRFVFGFGWDRKHGHAAV